MRIKPLHPSFKLPVRATELAGGYDLFMPEAGELLYNSPPLKYGLGFAAEVPKNHVALILPRSGKGVKHGLDLNNTVGVIDADYRGEWMATLRIKAFNHQALTWAAGDRLLQMLIVPVRTDLVFEVVDALTDTQRGTGGYGHTDRLL